MKQSSVQFSAPRTPFLWLVLAGFAIGLLSAAATPAFAEGSSKLKSTAKSLPAPTKLGTAAKTKPAEKPTKPQPQAATTSAGDHKIWLSVDVVEQTQAPSGPDNSRDKYRADAEVNVVDSASGKNVYARSGDMVQLQPRRTYFVMLSTIPQNNGVPLKVNGPRTQTLRTGAATDGDIMYERKFLVLPSGGAAAAQQSSAQQASAQSSSPSNAKKNATKPAPVASANSFPTADEEGNPGWRPSTVPRGAWSPTNQAGSTNQAPNGLSSNAAQALSPFSIQPYYVVQYCSLAEEADALGIRESLTRNGVRDVRIELHVKGSGERFYRVRSGAYGTLSQAKSVVTNPLWSSKQWQTLRLKPIVVLSGM